MIDLHVHSNHSDGTYTPSELVDYAIEKHLTAFCLTDHDTMAGLAEAISYANTCAGTAADGQAPVTVYPGIEISTDYRGREIHILGLMIDHQNPRFLEQLQQFAEARHTRNRKMCALLQEHGIDIDYADLQAQQPDAVITRAHFARFLLDHGYTKSMQEAFDRYIGDRRPCFVPWEMISPDQAIRLILSADGIPVLAHPIQYGMSHTALDAFVGTLKDAGLMGIEAIYSTYTAADERQIRQLAQKYHLLLSGGSDFHGTNKPGLDLGVGYGSLHVPDQILDDLLATRQKLLFTDLDGTLLLNDSTISDTMRDALQRMTDAGHHLILSSGRPLPSILEVRFKERICFPHMLIMSNNGALVYDCDRLKPIWECRVSQEDTAYIIRQARLRGLHIHGYTATEIVCQGMNAELAFYTSRIHMPLQCVDDIAAALPQGSFKLLCIHLTDKSALEDFRESLLHYCGDRIQMIFSNEQFLEILPTTAGKGNALRFIADFLHAPLSHTFAAGDAENDISMLAAAGTGIAMANAQECVKKAADIITQKSNDENGLLEILETYFQ